MGGLRNRMVQDMRPTTAQRLRFRASFCFCVSILWFMLGGQALAANESMQIVAHQDDDTLFMNPDLRNGLKADWGSTTVYLTAGETVGCCYPDFTTQTPAQFAASRQEGARAAYTYMMGVEFDDSDSGATRRGDPNKFPKDIDTEWVRSLCSIQGHYVEVDQLRDYPQVKLVFLNLPEASDESLGGSYTLFSLFAKLRDTYTVVPENWPTAPCIWPEFALAPDFEPPPPPSYYDHDQLAGVLLALLQKVQPSIVRTQDPYPYERCEAPDVFCTTGSTPFVVGFDNSDHQMTARFVREVLASYGQHGVTLNYIGYSIADRQGNLSDGDYVSKRAIFQAYEQYDGNVLSVTGRDDDPSCYTDPNCLSGYAKWDGAMYYRNPSNTTWLHRLHDGRLAAFGVRADGLVMWYETCPGSGEWFGPIPLGDSALTAGPVAPGIAVGTRANGLLQVFSLRTPQPPTPGLPRICTVAQNPSGDAFGPEVCLGNPNVTVPDWISPPAVERAADGRFWVFVKNDRGGVSATHEMPPGLVRSAPLAGSLPLVNLGLGLARPFVWSGWADLPGDPARGEPSGGAPDVIEGIVTGQGLDGRVEVFAQTRLGVIHQWYQNGPNGPWVFVPVFPSNAPVYLTHGLGVEKNADGRLEVFYRAAGRATANTQAAVFSVREQYPGGPWGAETELYGDAGHGPLAVVRHPTGPLLVFELNYYGGVSEISETAANGSFYPFQWQDLGGSIVHYPSAAIDAAGRTVLAASGPDAKLYVRRQLSSDASAPFSGWALAESGTGPTTGVRGVRACIGPNRQ